MAKVVLDRAQKKCDGFSIWVAGMLNQTGKTQEELAYYLGIAQSGLWQRIHGNTPWRLCEYYEVLEFFGEETHESKGQF